MNKSTNTAPAELQETELDVAGGFQLDFDHIDEAGIQPTKGASLGQRGNGFHEDGTLYGNR